MAVFNKKMFLLLPVTAMIAISPLGLQAAPPSGKPDKVEIKRIDWRPFQQAVQDAIKAKDEAKYKAALEAIEKQDPATFGKLNVLTGAVNAKRDPDFSVEYFIRMLNGPLSEADRNLVLTQLANAYKNQASAAMNPRKTDQAAFEKAIKGIEALPDTYRNKFFVLTDSVMRSPVFAAEYLPKMKPTNNKEKAKLDQAVFQTRIALANHYASLRKRNEFNTVFLEIESLPDDTKGKLTALASLAKYLDGDQTRPYLESLCKKTQDPAERFEILGFLRATAPLNARPYNFTVKENYQFNKSVWMRQKELIAADMKLDPKERKLNGVRNASMSAHAAGFAVYALDFGDYAFFEELLTLWYQDAGDKDLNCALMRMKNAIRKRDAATANSIRKSVEPIIRERLNDPKINNWMKYDLPKKLHAIVGLAVLNEKINFAEYDKAVSCGKETSAADRCKMLSYVSSEAFRAGRFDISQAIVKEIYGNMIKPEKFQRLTLKVEYTPDGPKTADAWLRSNASGWDRLDTRFCLYASYFEDSHNMTASKLLKGTVEPEVPAENRAGVQFAFDDEALHIFIRVNDPMAAEIAEGKRKGPVFEMLFRPGNDSAYHSDYLRNIPDTEQTFPQDWQRPGLDYTLTMDFIRRDVAITKDTIAVHYAIPFSAFFDKLPGENGREWTFGLQIWGKSALTFSCGVVHELSRMGLLDIKLTPDQKMKIKRIISRKAVNHAMKLYKEQGQLPRLWEDPVIGDADFYRQEIKPLFDEMLEADKKIGDLTDMEVDAFYEKYVRTGLKLEYISAEKRADWLRKA